MKIKIKKNEYIKKLYPPLLIVFLGVQAICAEPVHSKNNIEKIKAFLSTKKGKLAVGVVCAGTGIGIVSLMYYLSHHNEETELMTTSRKDQQSLCDYLIKNNFHQYFEFVHLKKIDKKSVMIILGGVDDQQKEKLLKEAIKDWPHYGSYARVKISFDTKKANEDSRHKLLNEQLCKVLTGQEKDGKRIGGVAEMQRCGTTFCDNKLIIDAVVANEKTCGSTVEEFKKTNLHEILSKWAIDKKKEGHQISLKCYKKTADNDQFLFTVEL